MPVFVEFSGFSKRRRSYLDEEHYRLLQNAILNETTRIDRIPGTGGLRKARWETKGKGKRGEARVIFFHVLDRDIYLMLLIYSKSEKDDLTSLQKKSMKRLVEQELKRLGLT